MLLRKGFISQHLVTISDLFCNFDVDKLKGKGNIKKKYKCKDKSYLCRKIFMRYMEIMMTDMFEGGKIFILPTKIFTQLMFREIPRQRFINLRKLGYYTNVDVLMSNFKCYEIIMKRIYHNCQITVPVKVSKNFIDRLVEKVNTGYKYC